jgi:hypothetical protein
MIKVFPKYVLLDYVLKLYFPYIFYFMESVSLSGKATADGSAASVHVAVASAFSCGQLYVTFLI